MSAPPSLHPSDQTLSDYGLGRLDAASAATVNAHLEGCAACRRRRSEMTSDSVLGKFRDGQPAAGSPVGPGRPGPTQSFDGLDVRAAEALPPGLAGHPDYEVLSELGRGGMGVVYLAKNTLMGRMEVLKVIGRNLTERSGVLDRFLREIRSVARLRHPNIVAAYHAFRIEAGLVFAMEHVDGFDLSKMVKNRGPLPVAHACLFAHQAALGLQHAHEEGMVHRDIKPGNLMVTRRGKKAVVKILDFGLAKATSEGTLDAGLTHEGQMLGTPDFIAPEQIVDAQKADIRADIYSLGCTLYYLLSGGPPFRGVSLYDLFQAHHSIDAKLLNFIRNEVPTDLAALVAKMMAKDPDRRFRTPGDVADALAPFTKKGGVTLKPKAEVSQEMRVSRVAPRPETTLASEAPAATPVPETVLPAEPAKPESRWSSLIDFREPEPIVIAPAPAGPVRRPPWKSWQAIAGAAAFGAVLLGIVIIIFWEKPEAPDGAAGAKGQAPALVARPADELVAGSLWESDKLKVSLRLVTRDGSRFTGFWSQGGKEYPLSGAVEGSRVTWRGKDVVGTRNPFHDHEGDLEGDVIRMRMLPNDRVKTAGSSYTLVLRKPTSGLAARPADVPAGDSPAPESLARKPIPRARIGTGTWTVEGDELVQSSDQVTGHFMFGDPDWSAYDLELEAQKVEGAGHGIEVVFHRLAPRTFAWFGLGVFENKSCEMYFEKDAKGDRASDNARENSVDRGINVGEWYSIKIAVRKSHYKCYLDGMLLFEGSHKDHTHGRIGLNTGKVPARFRKIKVTSPDGSVLFEGVPEITTVDTAAPPTLAVKAPAAPLFNGRDLAGWTNLLHNGSTWTVVDGVIEGRGSGKQGGPGVLVSKRQDLKDFRLRARLRCRTEAPGWVEVRHSAEGELVNAYAVMAGTWPNNGHPAPGSISLFEHLRYGTSADGWFGALPRPVGVDEWQDLMVDAYGDTVVTYVNGQKVDEYVDPRGRRRSGGIVLACSTNATIEYRSITVEEWGEGPGAAAAAASMPAADPARRVWACEHMTFENFEPGRWRELNDTHRRVFYYRESGRTGPSVELFNPFRGQGGIWVRLGEGRGEVKQGSRFGWSALAEGRWTSAPAAVAWITTAEAIGRLEEDVRKLRDPVQIAARGDAFKEVVDGLVADFEKRVAALRAAKPADVSGLLAWSEAVRDSAVFRVDPAEEARIQADPGFVLRAREAQRQLGEASYDAEALRASIGDGPLAAHAAGFVPLFNGKNLDGWQVATDPDHRWSVVDGAIVSAAPATFSRLDTKREDFTNFHLRLETMLAQGLDGAVDVRLKKDGDTLGFYAAVVAGTDSPDSRTGSLQLSAGGKRGDVAVASEVPIKPGEWFTLDLHAVDDTITVLVAGKEVARFRDPDRTHSSGSIGLFCRGGATMRFRNIEIKELAPEELLAVEEPAPEPLMALEPEPTPSPAPVPAAKAARPAAKAAATHIPFHYVNDFTTGKRAGLPPDPNVPHEPSHGQSDGVYFVYSGSGFQGWTIQSVDSDSTCEVVGRVLSTDPKLAAYWAACVVRKDEPRHGFVIKINVKGELFLGPNPYDSGAAFKATDPKIGPITHPAIRTGSAYNRLQLVMKGRELAILVNGIQVFRTLRFDYDLTPARLSLGSGGHGTKRAEFDRVEIREIVDAPRAAAKAK